VAGPDLIAGIHNHVEDHCDEAADPECLAEIQRWLETLEDGLAIQRFFEPPEAEADIQIAADVQLLFEPREV
jgi:hypothetical protein